MRINRINVATQSVRTRVNACAMLFHVPAYNISDNSHVSKYLGETGNLKWDFQVYILLYVLIKGQVMDVYVLILNALKHLKLYFLSYNLAFFYFSQIYVSIFFAKFRIKVICHLIFNIYSTKKHQDNAVYDKNGIENKFVWCFCIKFWNNNILYIFWNWFFFFFWYNSKIIFITVLVYISSFIKIEFNNYILYHILCLALM